MSEEAGTVLQEDERIAGRRITAVGAACIAVSAIAVGAMAWMLQQSAGTVVSPPAVPSGKPPTTPRVQSSRIRRANEGLALQRQAEQRLQRYGWVVRGRVAHIPIDDAIDWVLEDPGRLKGDEAAGGVGGDADRLRDEVDGGESDSIDGGREAGRGGGGFRGRR